MGIAGRSRESADRILAICPFYSGIAWLLTLLLAMAGSGGLLLYGRTVGPLAQETLGAGRGGDSERTRFWIPQNLAYKGEPGAPRGMLVFEIDLIRIQ